MALGKSAFRSMFRSLFERKSIEDALKRELLFHREEAIAARMACGLGRKEASRQIDIELGGNDLILEECRDVHRVAYLESLLRDVKHSLRAMGKTPGFAFLASLILALGIGANTAIFSIVNGILLRPLPGVRNASRLVDVYPTSRHGNADAMSLPDFQYYRDHNHSLDRLTAFSQFDCYLDAGGHPEELLGMIVSGEFFDVLGTRAAQGRFFEPDEDRVPGARPVAVLSYSLWQRRFGSDPGIIGRTVTINAHPYTVIGVAEAGFRGPWAGLVADVWVPLMMQPEARPGDLMGRNSNWLESVGRLKPGVATTQARADMSTLGEQLAQAHPESDRGRGVDLRPSGTVPGRARSAIVGFMAVLMAIVAGVLLIACSNVGAMMLGRFTARRKEIAVRLAIGASRGQIVRSVLIETMILFLAGGALGVLLALEATRMLASIQIPGDVPIALNLPIDWRVLTFTLALTLVAGLFFGLSPALRASRSDALATLRNDAAGSVSYRGRARGIFVTVQVALCLVLLISAGLLLKSLRNAGHIDPGFQPDGVQTARLNIEVLGYDESRGAAFYRELLERVRAIHGVESASLAQIVPLAGDDVLTGIKIDGQQPPPGFQSILVGFDVVDPEYFTTVNTPIVRGRSLLASDLSGSPKVAVVNQTMERRYFAGEAIGKHFTISNSSIEIVGVAKDGKYSTVGEGSRPFFYRPFEQSYRPRVTLLVRELPGNAAEVVGQLRDTVNTLERNLPTLDVVPMTQVTAFSLLPLRIAMSIAGLLGVLGLLLAAMGVFGVVNQTVASRTREIGTRMALGAGVRDINRMVAGYALRLTSIGIGIGAILAFALSHALTDLLYGVSSADPAVFVGVAALLAVVALTASFIPARRAARVDAITALRCE
ncbi:MAG TPA: ABC transporter permease [Blastocatellia bacterium]|nr:ABC transporter permease [Blastocatellia bacterium]